MKVTLGIIHIILFSLFWITNWKGFGFIVFMCLAYIMTLIYYFTIGIIIGKNYDYGN